MKFLPPGISDPQSKRLPPIINRTVAPPGDVTPPPCPQIGKGVVHSTNLLRASHVHTTSDKIARTRASFPRLLAIGDHGMLKTICAPLQKFRYNNNTFLFSDSGVILKSGKPDHVAQTLLLFYLVADFIIIPVDFASGK